MTHREAAMTINLVRAFKVTREMRAKASRDYYEKQDRVFRLTEGQRRQILDGSKARPATEGGKA
jgi:hypothetical protein